MPSDLPGDVLGVYGTWKSDRYLDMESLVFDWVHAEDGQDVSNYAVANWPFCAEGVIHRTRSYPSCDEALHDLGIDIPDLFQGTQIGAHPFRIQGETETESSLIASISSLQPCGQWPFVNCAETPRFTYRKGHEGRLRNLFEMMMGDMGSLYFFRDKMGQYTQSWDCY